MGVSSNIYKDIEKDEMKTGPDVDAFRSLTKSINGPIIAGRGISSLEDMWVLNIRKVKHGGRQ